jgi:hypothetical protein
VKKIPTLFIRDSADPRRVTREVTPGCEWVLAGEGVATRKWDGTACLVREGKLYKRMDWDAQKGPAPPQWLHHDFNPEQRSGHGWYPVGDGPEDWMHRLASLAGLADGTYELCGPKIGKNPEAMESYALIAHGYLHVEDAPRDFDGLATFLPHLLAEGIVWHHLDGRMAKIKRRDFGLPWPPRAQKPERAG